MSSDAALYRFVIKTGVDWIDCRMGRKKMPCKGKKKGAKKKKKGS